jgi:transcriptional regulator with XRE-family HTH domain
LTVNYSSRIAAALAARPEESEMTSLEYLDAVKERLGITSDYALAARLGITRSAVSKFQKGAVFGDDVALTVAEILQLNPLEVIAAANAERAKTPEQKARWTELMEKFSRPVASFRNLLSQWDGRTERRKIQRSYAQ